MLITDILALNARRYGGETALVECDPANRRREEINWQQFEDHANIVARALIDRGITKGDKVVLLMTNCLEWLPIYFGILRTGAGGPTQLQIRRPDHQPLCRYRRSQNPHFRSGIYRAHQ